MKAWKAWNKKPWKTMGSIGIDKNESMGSMVFSIILLLNNIQKAWKAWKASEIMKYKTMENHGKHGNL